jgi:coenzyme F420-reducing hydrogenase delta subunit
LYIIKALQAGADGVLVSGCHPGDCHYLAGNYFARRKFTIIKDILEFIGVEKERVQFAWVSASEGEKFAQLIHDVVSSLQNLPKTNMLVKKWR